MLKEKDAQRSRHTKNSKYVNRNSHPQTGLHKHTNKALSGHRNPYTDRNKELYTLTQ